jgi:hypothetical protein
MISLILHNVILIHIHTHTHSMFAVQLQQIGDIEVGSTRRDRKDSKQ